MGRSTKHKQNTKKTKKIKFNTPLCENNMTFEEFIEKLIYDVANSSLD